MRTWLRSLASLGQLKVWHCCGCGVGCRCGWDLALLWLWCRPAAAAQIRPLACERYMLRVGVALKRQKKLLNSNTSAPDYLIVELVMSCRQNLEEELWSRKTQEAFAGELGEDLDLEGREQRKRGLLRDNKVRVRDYEQAWPGGVEGTAESLCWTVTGHYGNIFQKFSLLWPSFK